MNIKITQHCSKLLELRHIEVMDIFALSQAKIVYLHSISLKEKNQNDNKSVSIWEFALKWKINASVVLKKKYPPSLSGRSTLDVTMGRSNCFCDLACKLKWVTFSKNSGRRCWNVTWREKKNGVFSWPPWTMRKHSLKELWRSLSWVWQQQETFPSFFHSVTSIC